jgi:putative spermidine/putrescine transport system substrate-binding protein
MAVSGAVVLALAGCGGSSGKKAAAVQAAHTIGQGEGALNLISWPGYTEAGGSDPRVNWVTPFENQTGCEIKVKVVASAQAAVDAMSDPSQGFDGVAAPPEVSGRLIAAGQVAPVNPNLIDGYKDLQPRLRGLLKKNGTLYGVPFMWGTNLLMYDSQVVQPGPDSWSALFDPAQVRKYAGRVIMRDTPLTIGDAALYLKAANAKLKITDPFELTLKQLDAAAALLKAQHHSVKSYWSRSADVVNAFASGASVLGQVWPYHVDVLKRAGRPVTGVTPKEGVTGWVDSWMIGAHAPHPSCMYQWVNYMSSQDVQQQVAEWNGVAPANPAACARDLLKVNFCAAYHVDDRTYIDKVMFAHTPDRDCGGGRRDCTDYADWTRAWNGAVS